MTAESCALEQSTNCMLTTMYLIRLTVTLGQFNTFYGYEVISPAANFNYTVSYLFNAGPFSHTGIQMDYAVN